MPVPSSSTTVFTDSVQTIRTTESTTQGVMSAYSYRGLTGSFYTTLAHTAETSDSTGFIANVLFLLGVGAVGFVGGCLLEVLLFRPFLRLDGAISP